jgi:hypothetical protein
MRQQLNWATDKTGAKYYVVSLESDIQAYHGRLLKARELYATARAAALRDDIKETPPRSTLLVLFAKPS